MFELGKLYHRAEVVDKDDGLAQMYLKRVIVRGNKDVMVFADNTSFVSNLALSSKA